jgi:hypothetical protein
MNVRETPPRQTPRKRRQPKRRRQQRPTSIKVIIRNEHRSVRESSARLCGFATRLITETCRQ